MFVPVSHIKRECFEILSKFRTRFAIGSNSRAGPEGVEPV